MPEKKTALLIASFQYDDPHFRPLRAPAQDVNALSRVLSDPAIGAFDEVRILLNEPNQAVILAIEGFFSDRNREDLLLLYFSGHGVKDEDGRLYYATRNTQHQRLVSTAVPAYIVNDLIGKSRSRRKILVLDCCYSGAFSKAVLTKGEAAVGVMEEFKQGQGLVTLTASDAFQYSFEGEEVGTPGVSSVFTRALVEGIETGRADEDGDQLIALDELYHYAYERVRSEYPQQRPHRAGEVEGDIIVARNPQPPRPLELSPDLQQAVRSIIATTREAAVEELGRLLRGRNKGLALTAREELLKLKEDDSLRVRAAAERCLAAFGEAERRAREAAEQERLRREAAERAEAERRAREAAEQERLRREAAERAEAERRAREAAEQGRLRREAAERAEAERRAREAAEQERLRREAAERAEAERRAREAAEQERLRREAAERAEAERRACEAAEQERLRREAAERAEAEWRAREAAEQEGPKKKEKKPWYKDPSKVVPLAAAALVALVVLLAVVSNQPRDGGFGCGAQPLELDREIAGTLSNSACTVRQITRQSTDESRADQYRLVLSQPAPISIDLRSSAFDPYLILLNSNMTELARDDDSGGERNARINRTLEAGTYIILAKSLASGQGTYYLRASVPGGPAPCAAQDINLPASFSGSLSATGCQVRSILGRGADEAYGHAYRITVRERGTLTLRLQSSAFDAYLMLLDANLGEIATDDDSGGERNARLSRIVGPGTYIIVAKPLGSGAGAYSLQAEFTPEAPVGPPVHELPFTVEGELTTSARRVMDILRTGQDRTRANEHRIAVPLPGTLIINLESGDFDAYLYLLDANNRVLALDNNGGGGTNARIVLQVPPGAYTILANSVLVSTGRYTLRANFRP